MSPNNIHRRPVPVNVLEYAALADACLPSGVLDFLNGGALSEVTLRENEIAFERWRILPRVLVDVSDVDTVTQVVGCRVSLPVLLAPVGLQTRLNAEAEVACARAAAAAGTVLIVSMLPGRPIEEVAAAVPEAMLWQQLYVMPDRGLTREAAERAVAVGARAIVLTVDTPVVGRRERDMRNDLLLGTAFDTTFSWKDVAWLRSVCPLPLVLKGILHPDDARLAVQHGASAIVVSNHGGRQLDLAPASIDMLPAVAEAVGGQIEILLDSGVRRGTSIITALALGATAVLVGRPYARGLAVAGQQGVEHVLGLLRTELEHAMRLCGRPTLAHLDRTTLLPAAALTLPR